MNRMMARLTAGAAMAMMMAAGPVFARGAQTQIAPASAGSGPAEGATYTNEQLLPLTVHEAWLMSGKSEANFFAMVTQLAELSAKNRNLQLPQTEEAGQKVGQMIKMMAKKDTDQLLYAVVDAAVRKVGTPMGTGSGL